MLLTCLFSTLNIILLRIDSFKFNFLFVKCALREVFRCFLLKRKFCWKSVLKIENLLWFQYLSWKIPEFSCHWIKDTISLFFPKKPWTDTSVKRMFWMKVHEYLLCGLQILTEKSAKKKNRNQNGCIIWNQLTNEIQITEYIYFVNYPDGNEFES